MGVSRVVVRPGKGGRPKVGDRVTMHYICRLASSDQIVDSSKLKGRAAEFQIGTGRVIQGWDEGLREMEIGEEAVLSVSADFAYGSSGRPPMIPPNADLEFTVELLAVNESMVAAARRVQMENIALAQEDEMIRNAHAEAGTVDKAAQNERAPSSSKKKRKHSREKDKKDKKRRNKSSDESSESSSSSSEESKKHRKSKSKDKKKRKKHH